MYSRTFNEYQSSVFGAADGWCALVARFGVAVSWGCCVRVPSFDSLISLAAIAKIDSSRSTRVPSLKMQNDFILLELRADF